MDVHQFPDAVPESGGNGGPRAPVVIGNGIVRRYGQGDTAVDALRGALARIRAASSGRECPLRRSGAVS